jgi:hypothetical protein
MISALATMIAKGVESVHDHYSDFLKKMTRRGFLKLLVAGGVLSTAYFSSPALTHIAIELGIRPESQTFKDFQAIFSDLIHPNSYAIVLRNIVWALKCIDLFETGIIPKDRVINIIGGLDHSFLDFFLRYPDIARKYWETFDYRHIAEMFSGGKPEWVYKSCIFDPSTKSKEIIIHKNLISLA